MTKPKPKAEHKSAGRPSAYRGEYAEQARKLCLLGYTDIELGAFFGVTEQTINTWKQVYPQFLEALTSGKHLADANVAEKLYSRAIGHTQPSVKIFNNLGVPMTVAYTEHFPPDTAAASMWLRNRQPKLWRNQPEPEGATSDIAAALAAAIARLPG